MGRLDGLVEFLVPEDVLAYHRPEVRAPAYALDILKTALVVLVVVFAKRHLATLHPPLLLHEPSDGALVLSRGHGQVEEVDVVVVQDRHAVVHVTRLGCVGRKFEIGIRTLFQIYEAAGLFFEFTDRTPKRVVDFTAPAATCDEGPLAVAPVVDDQKVRDAFYDAHRDGYGFMPLSWFEPWGHSRTARGRHPLLRLGDQKNLGCCPRLLKIYSGFPSWDYRSPER